MNETPLSNLSFAMFAESRSSKFRLRCGSSDQVELELIQADLRQSSGRNECFSLVFSGPPDRLLPQATYAFEHEILGRFPLFIVPVRRDQSALYYEAIFNRSTGGALSAE